MLRSVLNWFGFGESNNDGHSPQKGDGQDHGHGHTHGIVDPSIPTTARGIWAIKWSFLVLFLTAAMQAVVVWLSGSVALLADTIHNVADASTAIPLWIAFVLARRAPSPRFTFGLGRVEDLAGVAIVLVIFRAHSWRCGRRLSVIHPAPISSLLAVALAGVVGFLGNEIAAYLRIKTGREIESAALIADGYHARVDGITSLTVVLGAAGVWAGFPQADPIAGLLITAMIFAIVWQSARAVLIRTLDGVEPHIVSALRHSAEHAEGVRRVNSLRARWLGHRLHAEMTLSMDGALSLAEASRLTEKMRQHARRHLPALESLHVEIAPESGPSRTEQRPRHASN
jgi:cation diffusion facilitator family transporter